MSSTSTVVSASIATDVVHPQATSSQVAQPATDGQPPVLSIVMLTAATLACLASAVFFGAGLWEASLVGDAQSKTMPYSATEVGQLKAAQLESLTQFGWSDKAAGTIQIPIDRAMELTAQRLRTETRTAAPGGEKP